MRFNNSGNSYPENQPIFKAFVLIDGRFFKKGDLINVMESQNPNFKGFWRVTDSIFIKKENVKILF